MGKIRRPKSRKPKPRRSNARKSKVRRTNARRSNVRRTFRKNCMKKCRRTCKQRGGTPKERRERDIKLLGPNVQARSHQGHKQRTDDYDQNTNLDLIDTSHNPHAKTQPPKKMRQLPTKPRRPEGDGPRQAENIQILHEYLAE